MGWLIAILIGLLACSYAMSNADPSTMQAPPATTQANPGYGNHCGFGPNDQDVRGVVRVEGPGNPPCPTR